MAAFDWYQATIRAKLGEVCGALTGLAGATTWRRDRGKQGYGFTEILEGGEGRVCHVWHGGSHTYPHAVIAGEHAQAGAELIRVRFPELHTVTRADVREDFGDPGAFDRVLPELLEVARLRRVKVGTAGDHLLTMEGRTVYLGAPTSAVRLRLYDKAAELRVKLAANPVLLAQVPEHLTRFEAQVRPQTYEAKRQFAAIEPMDVMGSSGWLREAWRRVAGLDMQPVQVGKAFRHSDDDRAYAYMLGQYGGLLRRRMEDHGSWAALGSQIGQDLHDFDLAKQRAKRLRGG